MTYSHNMGQLGTKHTHLVAAPARPFASDELQTEARKAAANPQRL